MQYYAHQESCLNRLPQFHNRSRFIKDSKFLDVINLIRFMEAFGLVSRLRSFVSLRSEVEGVYVLLCLEDEPQGTCNNSTPAIHVPVGSCAMKRYVTRPSFADSSAESVGKCSEMLSI